MPRLINACSFSVFSLFTLVAFFLPVVFFSLYVLSLFFFSLVCVFGSLSLGPSLFWFFFFFTFLLPPCFPFLCFVHSPGFFRVLAPGSFLFSFPLFRSTRDLSPFLLKRSLAFIARDKNVVSSNHKVW